MTHSYEYELNITKRIDRNVGKQFGPYYGHWACVKLGGPSALIGAAEKARFMQEAMDFTREVYRVELLAVELPYSHILPF